MRMIRKHAADGQPVIGIRTASHAFALRKETPPDGHGTWEEWDKNHGRELRRALRSGKPCRVDRFPSIPDHPILKNLNLPFETPASLYRNSPLPAESVPLLALNDRGGSSRTACLDEPIAFRRQSVLHLTWSRGGLQETCLQQASSQRPAMVP